MSENKRPKLSTVFGKRGEASQEGGAEQGSPTPTAPTKHPVALVQLNVTVDAELRKAARLKALQDGHELAPVVRELLRRWVAGEIEV